MIYTDMNKVRKNHVFELVISSEQIRKLNLLFPAHHLKPDLIQSEAGWNIRNPICCWRVFSTILLLKLLSNVDDAFLQIQAPLQFLQLKITAA